MHFSHTHPIDRLIRIYHNQHQINESKSQMIFGLNSCVQDLENLHTFGLYETQKHALTVKRPL